MSRIKKGKKKISTGDGSAWGDLLIRFILEKRIWELLTRVECAGKGGGGCLGGGKGGRRKKPPMWRKKKKNTLRDLVVEALQGGDKTGGEREKHSEIERDPVPVKKGGQRARGLSMRQRGGETWGGKGESGVFCPCGLISKEGKGCCGGGGCGRGGGYSARPERRREKLGLWSIGAERVKNPWGKEDNAP